MHHRRGLRRLLKDDELLSALESDPRSAPVSPARRAMIDYALKLTRAPGEMVETDVEALREVGWTDVDILQIAEVTAYYAYVNRIADGLGVQLEDGD